MNNINNDCEIINKINEFLELKKNNDAKIFIENKIHQFPAKKYLYKHLGKILMSLNEFEQAVKSYEEYLKYFPEELESYINLGNSLIYSKNNIKAKEIFLLACEKFPDSIEGYERIGRLLLAEKEYKSAEIYYKELLNKFSANALIYYNYSLSLIMQKNTKQAENILKKAVKLFPDDLNLIINYSQLLLQSGKNPDQVIKILEPAIKKFPDDLNLIINYSQLLFQSRKNLDQVIKILEPAIKKFPDNEVLITMYCHSLFDSSKDDKLIEILEPAIKKFPYNEVLLHCYCNSLIFQRKYEQLHKILEQPIKKFPNNIQLLTQYGKALLVQEKYEELTEILKNVKIKKNIPDEHYADFLNISIFIESINLTALYLKEKKVSLLVLPAPNLNSIKDKTDFEKELLQKSREKSKTSLKEQENIEKLWGDLKYANKDYVKNVIAENLNLKSVKKNGKIVYLDECSEYVNILNGERITIGNPKVAQNTIYFFGTSYGFGWGTEDKYTPASLLQQLLTQNKLNYRISNQCILGQNDINVLNSIINTQFQEGDIVILDSITSVNFPRLKSIFEEKLTFIDVDYNERNKEIFVDFDFHITHNGNKIKAKKIFEYIKDFAINTCNLEKYEQPSFITDNDVIKTKEYLFNLKSKYKKSEEEENNRSGLNNYLKQLKKLKPKTGSVGSIVMNCNPFTNGHKYLIEYAAKQVDNLFVFVLEEDKSYFNFTDRLNMVKNGTKHLKNVHILKSGNFIISKLTFPEYFEKEKEKVTVDTSKDLSLFCTHIVPTLNIKTRFVGQEPNCYITNQYNEQMKKVFPYYGVELKEIPRIEFDNKIISASRVRKYIKEKRWEEIKAIVPTSTYDYLKKLNL